MMNSLLAWSVILVKFGSGSGYYLFSVTLTTFYSGEEKALLTLVVPENNGESKCERMNDANHRKCFKSLEEEKEGDEKERRRR